MMNTKNVEGLKEAVARIVDPGAAAIVDAYGGLSQHRDSFDRAWLSALSKAEAILALISSSPLSIGLDEEGWGLVPREPTEEMVEAALVAVAEFNEQFFERESDFAQAMAAKIALGDGRLYGVAYRAMLSAAPAISMEKTDA